MITWRILKATVIIPKLARNLGLMSLGQVSENGGAASIRKKVLDPEDAEPDVYRRAIAEDRKMTDVRR
jgi:hypothetical protein